MVAIFTGAGFGFERGSASVLGGTGLLGGAAQGRGGEGVYVNAATGNLVLQKQDEFLVGKGPDVGISRTYNSLTNTALIPDDNNDKWRQSTDRRVNGLSGTINTAGSTIKRISGDGTEITYTWDTAAATYVTKDGGGAYDKIVRGDLGGGNYEWVWTDGDSQIVERYAYDATGKIKSQTDINGFLLSFAYKSDGTGRLETVTTSDGWWIRYDYNGATNNITSVVTGTGATTILTRARYDYDGSNRLWKVTVDLTPENSSITDDNPAGTRTVYETFYSYNTYGQLATITQTDGSSLNIGYENNTSTARVSQIVQTATTGITRTTRIEYGLIDSAGQAYNRIFDAANPSTSADENATRLYTDASGNLTKIMAPAAFAGGPRQLVEFTYNANGDVTGVKDALGNTTGYSIFTANGLAQTVTDRLNNPVTRTFDAKNHLLSETRLGVDSIGASVSLTTRFVYDTSGNLRFRIDPEGRVTEWEWGFGANTRTIEYTDDAYITAGTPSDANMISWRNGLADSSKIAVVKYDYDGRNNLIASTRYGSTNTAGTFVTSEGVSKTNYVYDQAGQLLERWDEGKNHAVFAYDGMGRLKSEIDINGGQTTYVFNDTSTTTTVNFTNTGYVVTKTYNKAGDLLNVTESGAPNTATGTTSYAYDSLGRVRVRTDAVNGTKTYNIYDNAGRLTGEVDHAGYLTEYRYDTNNRLVGTIRYRIVSTANLANAAIPATWLGNPDNTVTIASIRPNTPTAQDISSWTVYDAEGRVRQTIAGDGSTVILTYDAAGRLQMSTAYFNKLASTDMNAVYAGAQAAVITPAADAAKDMVARNFYDKAGLLIGTLDALGYVVKNEYDKAGRLVSTTAFANASTAPNRATDSFATLTSPANLVSSANDRTTRLVYDARDLLRYKIEDVLVTGVVKGRVTAYYYQDNIDKVSREVVFDGYLAALGNYTLANVNTQTASLAASSGNRTSYFFYDAAERLSHAVSPTGTVSAFTYDIRGNVTKSVQFATAWSVGVPDATTIATFVTSNSANTANRVTRSWYTERGEAAYAVDAEGGLSRNIYNADGRQISRTIYDSTYAASDSTTLANLLAVPVVGITHYWDYDSLGRLVRETDGTGAQTAYGYFGTTGLVTVKIEADTGSVTERAATVVAYDGAGRVVQTVAATITGTAGVDLVDATITTVYDGRGMVQSITDPNSKTTSYAYYLNGRVQKITDALGNATNYEYNAFGDAWKVTDARGNLSYNWYDKLGRLTTSRDAGGYITRTAYTIFGEINRVTRYGAIDTSTPAMWTEPAGSGTAAITSFTYNKAGQVLTSTDAEGNAGNAAALGETRIETYGYNTFGDRTSLANRLEGTTLFTYDRLGRLVRQSVDAVTSNHDAAGLIIVGAQLASTFAYDTRGNVSSKVEGYSTVAGGTVTALRTTTYKYDNANRVSEVWHDQVTVIADDMVTVTTAVTPKEFYTYDQRGNLIKFVDAGGTQTFSYYDDLDRKTAEIRQLSATQWVYTKYTYDPNGNLTSTRVYEGNAGQPGPVYGAAPTVPGGSYRQTDFAYDNLNRMISSRVVSIALNSIVSGSWTGVAATGSYGTNLGSAVADNVDLITSYEYDANGNVVKLTDPIGGITWSWYDSLGRKTWQLDAEGYLTKWDYDAEGNVTKETRFSDKPSGTPQINVAPTEPLVDNNKRITDFTYDLNGNRKTETRRNVIAWNVDALTGALSAAGTDSIISYNYNALGQVVSKTVAGVQIASYTYDKTARLSSDARAAFTDANSTVVTPTTSYLYDALGDLVRTTQLGTATGTYTAADRATDYRYGEGGRLISMTDANYSAATPLLHVHTYSYDVMGRQKKDAYSRIVNLDNTITSGTTATVAEAQTRTYDLAGRVLSQSIYSTLAASFQRVGYTSFQYNNFDQVISQGTGSNAATGMNAGSALYQVANQYDAAGRLTATNAGDGVWKYFGYDKLGNQTIAITSAGYALTSATTFATALGLVGQIDVNGTYTVYDKRNMAVLSIQEGRQLSATVTQTLSTTRAYNAFGEAVSETNALGALTSYRYNTMGRMISSESAAVEITNENGSVQWVKPSQDYYYDLAGRTIATRDANGTYAVGGTNTATATSKVADTGNLTKLALLAGTGYDQSQALVATEFHADGGKKQTLYDRMGDARVIRDELYTSGTPNLHVSEQTFNRLGQLTQLKHNRATNVADDTTRLVDNYVYDQFGQRLQHWNSQQTSAKLEKSSYDALGRVTAEVDMGGYVTTTAYSWDGTLVTTGLGTFGGWIETTTNANARTAITKTDLYNRQIFKQDLGAHQFNSTFDVAGRMITMASATYTWYNIGLIATNINLAAGLMTVFGRDSTTYGYDAVGNRITELFVNDGSYPWSDGVGFTFTPYTKTFANATATYDALGRLSTMTEAGSVNTPAASITQKYDAAGNIRRTTSTHKTLNSDGTVSTTAVTDDFWFRFDAMNRMVINRGTLSGTAGGATTTIVRSYVIGRPELAGEDLVYDAAGQRAAIIRTNVVLGGFSIPLYTENREIYSYDGAGRIANIYITTGTGSTTPATMGAAPTSGGFLTSQFTYDRMGRQLTQSDYQSGITNAVYSRSAVYAANGRLSSDSASTLKSDGATYTTASTYSYTSATAEYLLGAVASVSVANSKNGVFQNNSSTTNNYQWWDSTLQNSISYKPNTAQSTTYSTIFNYDGHGEITYVDINDGAPRRVSYVYNGEGQIIRRDEHATTNSINIYTGTYPHEIWYRFNGAELGYVGNNGTTSQLTADQAVADRRVVAGTGAFRNGTTTGTSYNDFSQAYDAVNSFAQGSASGSYIVQRSGETLSLIAQMQWGDASLWYKIAEANGMSGDVSLSEGQRLTLPAGVTRSKHNAGTLNPYDANDAIGNVSPTTPKPKQNKCGVFGQILAAVVAVAATYFLGPVGGNLVSQGFNNLIGIQQGFSWGSLAMAYLTPGISAGVGAALGTGAMLGSQFIGDVVRGAVTSAVSQGVGIAVGAQDKFSWAGVAAAGIGAGVAQGVSRELASKNGFLGIHAKAGSFGNEFASITASTLANAATRSAIEGSNFGDNLQKAVPDALANLFQGVLGRSGAHNLLPKKLDAILNGPSRVIANTIGNIVADGITSLGKSDDIIVTSNGGRKGDVISDGTISDPALQGLVDKAKGYNLRGLENDYEDARSDAGEIRAKLAAAKSDGESAKRIASLEQKLAQREARVLGTAKAFEPALVADRALQNYFVGKDVVVLSGGVESSYKIRGSSATFTTADDAAFDAISTARVLSAAMSDNLERTGYIVSHPGGGFTYEYPYTVSGVGSVMKTYSIGRELNAPVDQFPIPRNAVGMWHTHPKGGGGDDAANVYFGPADIKAAQQVSARISSSSFAAYLGGSDGGVRVIRNANAYRSGFDGSKVPKADYLMVGPGYLRLH